jgi:PadR family transcriptional regulator PadR
MEVPVTAKAALLQVLLEGPGYGTELAERVDARTKGEVKLLQGSIYPALGKFEVEGLVKHYTSQEGGGRAKIYYQLTKEGKALAEKQRATLLGLCKPAPKRRAA